MKQLSIVSGKGGTGKTTITAAFAALAQNHVMADGDVDAADLHLILTPQIRKEEEFYGGRTPSLDKAKCDECGICMEVCRFDAIPVINDQYIVQPLDCEGCGYCARVCPTDAITNESQNVGKWYISTTKVGSMMVHARLGIGADNSGKLVAKVKNEAKQIAADNNKGFVIVDGSPGVGCPVVSSLSGANFVVLVTEPTVSGLHDLRRVYQLVKKFHIKAGCIINKSDLNRQVSGEIEEFLKTENIVHIASLPYDETFTRAMTIGQTIVEYQEGELKDMLTESWNRIRQIVT